MRIALGGGWALLLTALALSFVAQSHVAIALSRMDEPAGQRVVLPSSVAGTLSPWLIVFGLALIGMAMLIA